MKVFTTENIRNISLLGHRGSGKTTLVESILYVKDYIKRKGDVENGTTVSDFDKEEIRRIFSINTSLIPVEHNDVKLNFLDTPGYFDFVGEVVSALRVSASAVLVLDATAGVEVGTEKAWKLLEERKLPRIIFVNKMDKGYVNYPKLLNELKEKFGKKIAPFCIPIGEKDEFKGFVNVVDMVGRVFDGKECVDTPIPADIDVSEVRNLLFEAIAETDEALMDKYFAGEEFTKEEIVKGLHKGVVNGDIVPVMVGSAQQNIGIHTLLNYLELYMPCPTELFSGQRIGEDPTTQQEKIVKISSENPFSAIVFKTLVDPFIGKISFFKVNSGTIKKETEVFNPKKNKKERIAQILTMQGNKQIELDELCAGDIGATTKLQFTQTGDTLCDKNFPVVFNKIRFPKPNIYSGVLPADKNDDYLIEFEAYVLHFFFHYFLISLFLKLRKGYDSLKLSERQKKIVEIVKTQQPVSGERISELLDISRATLRSDFSFLTLVGILKATPKIGYTYSGSDLETETVNCCG